MRMNKSKNILFNKERITEEYRKHASLFTEINMFRDKSTTVLSCIDHPALIEFMVIANHNEIWDKPISPSISLVWRNDILDYHHGDETNLIVSVYTRDEKRSPHLGVNTTQATPVLQFYRDTLTQKCEALAIELDANTPLGIFLITAFALKDLWMFMDTEANKFVNRENTFEDIKEGE